MSTPSFHNIALLGATGNLGSKILAALNAAGFTVTAIQRANSEKVPVGAAKSLKVDLGNESALTTAFKDQDVVISALPFPTLETDKPWISAAIAAGVKRIVPSEFSTNMDNPLAQSLPIIAEKVKVRKCIEVLGASGVVEWNSINNGPFFVHYLWLSGHMGPAIKSGLANTHDGGSRFVPSSTLEQIAEAVARALLPTYAALTKNQPVYIYSAVMSERKAIDLASKITGIKFKETDHNIDEMTKNAYAALEKGDMSKMFSFFYPFCFGEGYGGDYREKSWNKKLGLKALTDEEIEETFRGWIKGMGVSTV